MIDLANEPEKMIDALCDALVADGVPASVVAAMRKTATDISANLDEFVLDELRTGAWPVAPNPETR